jgi:HSP20 family molecular chaperone IbpA
MADKTSSVQKTPAEVTRAERTRSGQAYLPNVDIIELADELLVMADVPGARAEDIDIHFEKGSLEIHAKVPPRVTDGAHVLLQEYGVGDFHRCFEVSESIDAGRIHADYADGVLTLHLPKVEAVKPRKIAVKTG